MKKKELRDFLWSTIGSVIFGFISVVFLMITTRINGLDIAGAFTYSFAMACIFWTIGSYSGKTFQITETNKKISDSDFLYNKGTTIFIMVIISLLFCIIAQPGWSKSAMIIILTLFRGVDCFIDSIHCIIQRNHELHKVGKSMILRTCIIIFTFFLIDYVTNNIIYACVAILLANILYCYFIDFYLIKNKFEKNEYNKSINKNLLKMGFCVFLYSFLAIIIASVSKYAMNTFETDDMQAIFGIIILPASFLTLFSQYLIQPFLNSIMESINEKSKKALYKNILKIAMLILGLGALAILICYLMGIPILELLYGVSLTNQLKNLIIVLCGSIFYSLAILCSTIFIALRRTIVQLTLLIITSIIAFLLTNHLTASYGIDGAVYAYTITMSIEFIFHFLALFLIFKKKEKKVSIRLMGGLGNQMFQYAVLRAQMMNELQKGVISLKGITNKTHNVFSLNHFNINKDVQIISTETIKSKFNYLLYGFYCVFLKKRKNGFSVIKKIQPILNFIGLFCVPDGYVKLNKSQSGNNVMIGYYQSPSYFNEYKEILKKELKVKEKVLKRNQALLNEIVSSPSVCVHIRRGDYVGTNFQVCNEEYYLKAMKIMKEKIKNPNFYIFSDDIKWVKENIHFQMEVSFVEGNNPNYEELRLMYSCKHFIISNSSFSWWAQYLTENKNRITIAPKKWYLNQNQKVDIYEEDWMTIE